jgi:hypothetical protein
MCKDCNYYNQTDPSPSPSPDPRPDPYTRALDLTLDPASIGLTVLGAFIGYKAESNTGARKLGYILSGGLLGLYMLNLSQTQSH